MFTVNQLSHLAGLTRRTLHYYDEIGLLKPTQMGANGYRYYDDDALLRLQQIMSYRQLDLPLEQIRTLMSRPDFAVLDALESHKRALRQRIERLERLIATVDQTMLHLKGKTEMSQKQLFEAFSPEQQAEYEKEAMRLYDPEVVKASNRKWRGYSAAEKQRIAEEGNALYQEILDLMPKGAGAPEAQAWVGRWRRHIEYFWTPNDEQLLGLANGYNDDPRFKATFDKIDPRLAPFIREVVTLYAAGKTRAK
jgi:DNA-binding transcriptional MerR regulator